MMLVFLLIVFLNSFVVGIQTYEFGFNKEFGLYSSQFPNFSCDNNIELTTTITFSDTFQNVPQIILFVTYYDSPEGYKLSTGSIQKTYFEVKLKCPSAVSRVQFYWVAIDDKRISVKNYFNQNVPLSSPYYFTHNNPYATQVFVGVTSFYSTAAFSIGLQVSISNSITVKVDVSKSGSISNLGFFVVAGTADAFTQASLKTLNNLSAGTIYTSPALTISQTNGEMIFVPIINVDWSYTSQNIRIRTNYLVLTDTSYQYNLQLWSGSKFDEFSFKEVTFEFHNYKVLTPFLCKKMKISKKYQKSLDSNTIKLYHKEEDKFYYPGDSQTFDYTPDDTQTFTISIYIQCKQSTKKYSVKVLKCFSCTNQYYTLNLNCYGSINIMQHDIYYQQTDLVYQKLSLSLTDTTISITQKVVTDPDAILLQVQ